MPSSAGVDDQDKINYNEEDDDDDGYVGHAQMISSFADQGSATSRKSCLVASTSTISSSSSSSSLLSAMTTSTSALVSALVISASDKAGMEGIDRCKIDEIILRESAHSKYMQQQRKRDNHISLRIQQLQRKLKQAKPHDLQYHGNPIDATTTSASTASCSDGAVPTSTAAAIVTTNTSRSTCVVVDMDMFYMACELLSRPELKESNLPACVGRGMILTSNYPARRYGVRSAMPGFIGDKLVEELSGGTHKLIHVPSNFSIYKEKSKLIQQVLCQYDPWSRSHSLDEAYLDVGPYLALRLQHEDWTHDQIQNALYAASGMIAPSTQDLKTATKNDSALHFASVTNTTTAVTETVAKLTRDLGSPRVLDPQSFPVLKRPMHPPLAKQHYMYILEMYSSRRCLRVASKIVTDMRRRVFEATGGLTCSAGLAPNFMLAKIASDRNKPNGQLEVDASHVLDFVHPLPIRKIPGIGRVTEKILQAFDIHTVRDMYHHRGMIQFLFQPVTAKFLLRASVGSQSSCVLSGGRDSDDDDKNGEWIQKGISRERTFSPTDNWTYLNTSLEDIGRLLFQDMARKQVRPHALAVKVKLHTFDVLNRSKTLPRDKCIQAPDELVNLASELLHQIRSQHLINATKALPKHTQGDVRVGRSSIGSNISSSFSCRLLGIRCSNLTGESTKSTGQLRLDKIWSSAGTNSEEISSSTQQGHSSEAKEPSSLPSPSHHSGWQPIHNTKMDRNSIGSRSQVGNSRTSKTKLADLVACALCNRPVSTIDNDELNRHIDFCLSATAIRQAVRDSAVLSRAKSKQTQRLTDFFGKSL